MTYNLSIKKNASGKWIVEPDDGPNIVSPGDIVKWQIDPGESVTAHIQFLDDIFESSSDHDEHLVSVLQQGSILELTVAEKSLPEPRVRQRT